MAGRRRTVLLRARAAIAAVLATSVVAAGAVEPSRAAASTRTPRSPDAWAQQLCDGLVAWQAVALDSRDAALAVVRTPPTDRAGVKASALALDAALRPPAKAIAHVTTHIGRRPPRAKRGAALAADVAAAIGGLADVYDTARKRAVALESLSPQRFATHAPRVLTKLDADLDRAGMRDEKLDNRLKHSEVGASMLEIAQCRRVGLEWTTTGGALSTPEPAAVDPATPGADDVTAPAVLLPSRYRPNPEIAALAARTTMTGLARTYFYAADPVVQTGQALAASCATDTSEHILGCFSGDRIHLLGVTRPEVVSAVDVTAAHELLHAVYEDLSAETRQEIDAQLSALYDATPDVRLRRAVATAEQRGPDVRANELHSLVGTQLGTLTPPLDEYYGQYFENRRAIVSAYVAYVSVLETLLERIDALRQQTEAARDEAQRLLGQIEALRAQGRVAESNALVASQNDAVRRAQSLAAEGNALIREYHGMVAEI